MTTVSGLELGFATLENEVSDHELVIEGSIPGWLDGALIRNGPAQFEVGGERVAHWFDGLGMLHRFGFEDGAVRYTNRFLRSETYRAAQEGHLTGQFATGGGSYLRQLADLVQGESTDNCNVHVVRVADQLLALTEVARFRTVNPHSLADEGEFHFADSLPGAINCAHMVPDPHRGETVGLLTDFGREHAYRFYRIPDGSRTRIPVAHMPIEKPAYIHSFGLSEQYIVLTEHPFRADPRSFLTPDGEGFVDHFDWEPERGTHLHVIDRDTGRVVTRRQIPSIFVFHHINAFEQNDDATGGRTQELVLDLIEYPDPDVIEGLYLDALADWFRDGVDGRVQRYRIPLPPNTDPQGVTVERMDRPVTSKTLATGAELPHVAPEDCTRQYSYAFAQGSADQSGNHVLKVAVDSGETTQWGEEDVFVEEPVFVRAPSAAPPSDRGVILVTGLDTAAEQSVLYVLDATELSELARAPLPHAVPFGFHGRYFQDW